MENMDQGLTIPKMGADKGHKRSKLFFQVDISSKKRSNEFYFTTIKPQVDLFFVRFLEEIEDKKKTFRCYLTFSLAINSPNAL